VVGRDWLTREAMLSQRLETAAMIGVGVLMALVAVLLYAVAKLRQRKNELQELTGELLRTQQSLVSAARQAGMAEIANGVLHNLGNALNSVNVSLACAEEKVRDNHALEISKVSQLLGDHQSDLGEFLTKDERGKQLPGYLETLSLIVMEEQKRLLTEFSSLSIGIEHVKDIVNTHQAYAGASLVCEPSKPADIILDALRMSTTSLARHSVKVVKKLADIPALQLDRHKILQILLNFISNAIDALGGTDKTQRTLEICLEQDGGDFVISATDSGAGMAPETLAKIFTHGFTTKKDGHGFGLHSAFLAARSMQGSLTAHSEGLGKGATFVLRLPMKPEPAATGAAAVAGAGLRN
jgi:signal transduction histidine kinase